MAVIEYAGLLQQQKKFVIAQQLLKALRQSVLLFMRHKMLKAKIDFIYKFKMATKEVGNKVLVDFMQQF